MRWFITAHLYTTTAVGKAMSSVSSHHSISNYTAPHWAMHLPNVPEKRISLAMLPTPIHRWNIPDLPQEMNLYVKRDDMTGSSLSGNKVRKLEFLLADALLNGCKSVITCGSIQSNHCRATAVAARELGLDCHLLLRSGSSDLKVLDNPGNLLPSVMCNSHIYFIPKSSTYATHIKPKQDVLADQIKKETGHSSYSIPVGGSNKVGVFGYIEAWEELMKVDDICERFTDVVVACGSGGTIAGLAIGNYLTGQKVKIHGITVCDNKDYFNCHVNEMLEELGITSTNADDVVDMIDGYKGLGYGKSTKEEQEFHLKIAQETGILCDPVYTGKAVKGMLSEFKKNPQRFNGNRILFIHTGGVFSLYDGIMKSTINQSYLKKNPSVWPNDVELPQNLF